MTSKSQISVFSDVGTGESNMFKDADPASITASASHKTLHVPHYVVTFFC